MILEPETNYQPVMIKAFAQGRLPLMRMLAVCLMVLIASPYVFAQNTVNVSGTVLDQGNNPLAGIGVQEEGTLNGTITDNAGRYSLTVKSGANLVFSSIGFTTQVVPVGGRSVVNVSMAEDVEMLEGTVVVGYGTQKKVNLTGAVEQVGEEVLRTVPFQTSPRPLKVRYLTSISLSLTVNQTVQPASTSVERLPSAREEAHLC